MPDPATPNQNASTADTPPEVTAFIAKWETSEAAERANYQTFLSELCDLLDVPRPDPTVNDDADNAYVFDRTLTFNHADGSTSTGFIDLYKRDCFILEAKQGSNKPAKPAPDRVGPQPAKKRVGTARRGTASWDKAMLAAKGQAERYARDLPATEGNPPLLITVDIGHTFELFADFSRLGRTYTPFPDPSSHRIKFADLAKPEIRERLRLAWTAPLELDPSRRSARVTRQIADRLATLSRSLEKSGHDPELAAQFLMRCLFTLFAEDIGLLPNQAFTRMLKEIKGEPDKFAYMAQAVWQDMNKGGFCPTLREKVLRFNGGLFADSTALPLDADQLDLLTEAAERDWQHVEPAIFGTLLERALNPRERHKFGAHFTPRAYVERLVLPTVIEPLREQWHNAQAAAITRYDTADDEKNPARARERAREIVTDYLRQLCNTTVLDPACGSGNFLYVTLEHMKRLEGEVRDFLGQIGGNQSDLEYTGLTVDPHLLKGIEINPRAAALADLVLWIGYLQWHHRVHGNAAPAEPVLKKFDNIENRDAVLAYDAKELITDEAGKPLTRWDGHTTKKHPVTGEDVPDESATAVDYRYVNPRKADWPKADYVVGNPPFIGSKMMRAALGDGYVDALHEAWKDVPEATDFVLRWWHQAALLTRTSNLKSFGLITTNSVSQSYNRRVIALHLRAEKDPLVLAFAIPNHPWVDSGDGADVRIAMTVGSTEAKRGALHSVESELRRSENIDGDLVETLSASSGWIAPNIRIGADVAGASTLRSNEDICCVGYKTIGSGFILSREQAMGFFEKGDEYRDVIRPYLNGRDLNSVSRDVFVIDLYSRNEEQVRSTFPDLYQYLLDNVKPYRDQNRNPIFRETWWVIGHPRPMFRSFTAALQRYVCTVETSRHRMFGFLDHEVAPDSTIVTIGISDGAFLGCLASRVHITWALAAGGRMGIGDDPRYNKTKCFEQFPFPGLDGEKWAKIEPIANQLDAHRKRQQADHPKLTLTNIYNVLEKIRADEPLTEKDKEVHEQGLVSVLKQLHDDLDAAVFAAYGWSDLWEQKQAGEDIDEPLLERLVALNAERAAEEAAGKIRWLRPDFQNPDGTTAHTQQTLAGTDAKPKKPKAKAKIKKQDWPDALPQQTAAVRGVLVAADTPLSPADVAKHFRKVKGREDRIAELLETLALLGQARSVEGAGYAA